jgi:hypothetical protein
MLFFKRSRRSYSAKGKEGSGNKKTAWISDLNADLGIDWVPLHRLIP